MKFYKYLLFLVLFCQCKTQRGFEGDNKRYGSLVIEEILTFMTNENFGYHLNKNGKCTKIYSKLIALEKSAYYNIWHYHLIEQRGKGKNLAFFNKYDDKLLFLDTIDLKNKVQEEFDLVNSIQIRDQCFEFHEGEITNEVLYFSPIIKMNKKNWYHISLKIIHGSENPEFLFLLKRDKNKDFKIVHFLWDDYWPRVGIGNERDIFKES